MSIVKKIIFSLLILLFAGAAAYGYFYLKSIKKPGADAFTVVPDSCLVYLRTSDFFELQNRINSQSVIADKLKAYGEVRRLFRSLRISDSLFSAHELLEEQLKDNSVHFALYGKETLHWLLSFNIRELGSQQRIAAQMAETLSATKLNEDIYSTTAFGAGPCYFSLREGIVVFSDSQELLRRGFGNSRKLAQNPDFGRYTNTFSESNLAAVYIDHTAFSASLAGGKINLQALCGRGLSASALSLDPSSFTLIGYLAPDRNELLPALSHQEPRSPAWIPASLPDNTISFKAWGFTSLKQVLAGLPGDTAGQLFWKAIDDSAMYNASQEFLQNTAGVLAEFSTRSENGQYLVMRVNDTLKAREHLQAMSDTMFYRGMTGIYHLMGADSTGTVLMKALLRTPVTCAMLQGEALYFAAGTEALVQLSLSLRNGDVLENDRSFMNYLNGQLSEAYNYVQYHSPARAKEKSGSVFGFRAQANQDPYANLRHVSLSVSNNEQDFKFRLHLLNEAESGTKAEKSLWTFQADTLLSGKPDLFVNHITRQNELLVQDAANGLYLINAKGNLLWKRKMAAKILSPIHMVDAFRNNKNQMLFNTATHLYLIDRNGKDVEGYPVKLPAPATAALCLTDYENNRDYRVLVPCSDQRIYNFGITGWQHPGFSPVKTDNPVELPVQYVKAGPYDYLVALDNEGKIYVFNRRGLPRMNLRNRTTAGCSAFYVDAGNNANTTHLVYIDDKSALVNKISFTDKKEIARLNTDMNDASVAFSRVDDNRLMDVIISSGPAVSAYNLTGGLLLEKTFEDELAEANYYSDESRSCLYALGIETKTLFLWDPSGRKVKTYPATAMPLLADLFNDHSRYMLIANGDRLSCVQMD